MYRKEDVLKKLNADNYYIDIRALESFIREWQIDAIYEAKDGTEFYDDTAIYKIKKGISLKSQGYNVEQICYRIHKTPVELSAEKDDTNIVEEAPSTAIDISKNNTSPEIRNVTLNVTNQTLQMLADAVAGKLTEEIKNHIDATQFSDKLVEAAEYKKDNETLAKQVEKLLDDNKKLAKRVQELEEKTTPFWKKIW